MNYTYIVIYVHFREIAFRNQNVNKFVVIISVALYIFVHGHPHWHLYSKVVVNVWKLALWGILNAKNSKEFLILFFLFYDFL